MQGVCVPVMVCENTSGVYPAESASLSMAALMKKGWTSMTLATRSAVFTPAL